MRRARIRYDRELCYYHLLNRVVGERNFFPFSDVEKEQFFRLALELSRLYAVELLSLVVMSNHYRIVCAAPAEAPGKAEIQRRWQAYYGEKKLFEPNWDDAEVVAAWGARLRDISCFIKDLQQRFTSWFNRTRPTRRRGTLWADRFKNVIVEGETALWDCIRYVEMNSVRARICMDPAEYRLSSWGRYRGRGRHPFRKNMVRHLRRYLGDRARNCSGARVLAELNGDMARVAARRGFANVGLWGWLERSGNQSPAAGCWLSSSAFLVVVVVIAVDPLLRVPARGIRSRVRQPSRRRDRRPTSGGKERRD